MTLLPHETYLEMQKRSYALDVPYRIMWMFAVQEVFGLEREEWRKREMNRVAQHVANGGRLF